MGNLRDTILALFSRIALYELLDWVVDFHIFRFYSSPQAASSLWYALTAIWCIAFFAVLVSALSSSSDIAAQPSVRIIRCASTTSDLSLFVIALYYIRYVQIRYLLSWCLIPIKVTLPAPAFSLYSAQHHLTLIVGKICFCIAC